MKKIFISKPVPQDITEEELEGLKLVEEDIVILSSKLGENGTNAIDTYGHKPDESLSFLADTIKAMSQSDIAYFAKGWQDVKACVIEHQCAMAYGMQVIVAEFDPHKTVIGKRLDAGLWD